MFLNVMDPFFCFSAHFSPVLAIFAVFKGVNHQKNCYHSTVLILNNPAKSTLHRYFSLRFGEMTHQRAQTPHVLCPTWLRMGLSRMGRTRAAVGGPTWLPGEPDTPRDGATNAELIAAEGGPQRSELATDTNHSKRRLTSRR